MKKLKKDIGVLFLLSTLIGWQSAQAQFAGDVFFANPSIAIVEGGQSQIEVMAFMGDSTFGAVQLNLTYDPAKLAIVSVQPGSTPELQNGFTIRQQGGVLSIIALNGASDTTPIGTVSLALIEVAPLTAAGTVVNVDSNVDTVLRQDSTAFSSPNGFGAEIVVTNPPNNPATISAAVDTATQSISGEVYQRALELRPGGSAVSVMVLDERNNATATLVQTRDPNAPSE